jgi:hypothetical protein
MTRPPTYRQRHRDRLAELARRQLNDIRGAERPAFFVPETAGPLLREKIEAERASCVFAIQFEADSEEFVARVGLTLERGFEHGFSDHPVLAIMRGNPFCIWTVDRNPFVQGEILAGRPSEVVEFSGPAGESV